jgi:hypothetical protein
MTTTTEQPRTGEHRPATTRQRMTAREIRALDPLLESFMTRSVSRPAYIQKMAWPMPRMLRAIPYLGYTVIGGTVVGGTRT